MTVESQIALLSQQIADALNRLSDQGSTFDIIMEENSSLNPGTNSGYQFSFGNGSTSINGYTVPFDSDAISLSFSSNSNATGVVELYMDGAGTGETITLASEKKKVQILSSPVFFLAGSQLTFRTISGSGGAKINVSVTLSR